MLCLVFDIVQVHATLLQFLGDAAGARVLKYPASCQYRHVNQRQRHSLTDVSHR